MDNFDTERLISEIQNKPCIWDTSSSDYSNRELKKKCWEEIVNCFGGEELPVGEKKYLGLTLQKRWKGVRTCYAREMKRQKEVKSVCGASNRKSEYIYYRQLQFLQKEVASGSDTREPPDNVEDFEDNYEINSSAVRSKKRRVNNMKTRTSTDDPFIGALNNYIETRERREKEEEDEDRMFLLSLLNTLKEVPRERKLATKIKLMTILNEATQYCYTTTVHEYA